MDRRSSKDAAPQRPRDNPDAFDGENAPSVHVDVDVDADVDEDDFMPSVSDGFRPGNANHDRNEPARPHMTTANSADSTELRRVATRNSTAKVPFDQDSSPHTGRLPNLHNRGPSSQATTPLNHRESVSSTASFATTTRPDSPLGTGPSHPYGMYPQHTIARNSSIATNPPPPQPQQSSPLQHPAHPYGMYPQNVIEDEEPIPVPQVQTAIPVGFPGTTTAYRRQIGPDGEEQDIIGLDGHTEQLPPYSRYPEEGPTKASLAAEASATSAEAVPNPRTGTDDALLTNEAPPSPVSPISPATPVAPVAPALLPQQRPETQTGSVAAPRPATNSESASLLTNEEGVSEKPEVARSVRKVPWRQKRLWGKIPVTVALVLLVVLLIFAIILGAAIGTFLAKQNRNKSKGKDKDKHEDAASQVTTNSLFDATPITTPTSLPPLPTGDWFLPLGSAQESSPGCLTQGNQYSAWSCRMSFAPLILTITESTAEEDPPIANVKAFMTPDGAIQYGLQPPTVTNQSMQLVSDLDFKGYGPAWHFSANYDKIVILLPDEFAAGSSLRKRQSNKPYRHRFQVQPGDNPWVCTWNQTYIEGYIYAQDNSTAATVTTSFPTPNPTDLGPIQTADPSASAPDTPAPTSPQKRQETPFPRLQPYPRIVKIEERRVSGAPQPLCQKMQLLENGQLAVPTIENGGPVLVRLQEKDPDTYWLSSHSGSDPSSDATQRRDVGRRGDPSDSCHCQWMFQ